MLLVWVFSTLIHFFHGFADAGFLEGVLEGVSVEKMRKLITKNRFDHRSRHILWFSLLIIFSSLLFCRLMLFCGLLDLWRQSLETKDPARLEPGPPRCDTAVLRWGLGWFWNVYSKWPLRGFFNIWFYKSYRTHGTVENKIESLGSRFSIFYDSMSCDCDLYHAPSFKKLKAEPFISVSLRLILFAFGAWYKLLVT